MSSNANTTNERTSVWPVSLSALLSAAFWALAANRLGSDFCKITIRSKCHFHMIRMPHTHTRSPMTHQLGLLLFPFIRHEAIQELLVREARGKLLRHLGNVGFDFCAIGSEALVLGNLFLLLARLRLLPVSAVAEKHADSKMVSK